MVVIDSYCEVWTSHLASHKYQYISELSNNYEGIMTT